jgi:hypothetical protein
MRDKLVDTIQSYIETLGPASFLIRIEVKRNKSNKIVLNYYFKEMYSEFVSNGLFEIYINTILKYYNDQVHKMFGKLYFCSVHIEKSNHGTITLKK